MTLEITRGKSNLVYRINPYAPSEIDVKENKPRARWKFFKRCSDANQASAELMRLEFAQKDARR